MYDLDTLDDDYLVLTPARFYPLRKTYTVPI